MKKIIRIRLIPLMMMGVLLILSSSCKKDEDNSIKDGDGNVYNTVTIGAQVWMVENLKTTKYNDGTAIPLVTDNTAWSNLTTPGYCWYNNDIANKNVYGALYNWYAVNTDKLCPVGWHVPSDDEWTTMENYLITNGYNYDGTTTGNKIAKSLASVNYWTLSDSVGAVGNTDYPAYRNKSGFSALPGGWRYYNGDFDAVEKESDWWSSYKEPYVDAAWEHWMYYSYRYIGKFYFDFKFGCSVRCIKD